MLSGMLHQHRATKCSGAMLHTPSKQSALPRGPAAQRCIRFCLSLACPPRSKKIMALSCLSFSLLGNILFCFSLTLSCLSASVSISLSLSCHCWESCSLSVSPHCLFYSLQGNAFSYLSHSFACPPRSKFLLNAFSFSTPSLFCLLILFLRLCSTLSGDTTTDYHFCSTLAVDNTADYRLCSTLSGDTTPDYPMCSTLSSDTTTDYPLCFVC
jgi:hypothetical protein